MADQTCWQCGKPLSRSSVKFCPHCGAPQNNPKVAQSNAISTTPAMDVSALPNAYDTSLTTTQRLDPSQSGQSVQPVLAIDNEGVRQTIVLGNKPLTLGRAPDNDIVIQSRFVSGYHARIEPDSASHHITDLGSTNGILAEGRRIPPKTPLTLADGDILRIGDPATGNFVTLTYHNPQVQRSRQADRVAHSYKLDPNDPEITIGRAGNDIVLENPQVSRQHAVIQQVNGQHVLRDLGSTNGTFVGSQRITEHTLRPGNVIQIGAFKLVYDGDSLDEYDQRGDLRIDGQRLSLIVRRNGQTRHILKDVSLSIAPREFVAIVGGSGTGKSTLLKALSGYSQATQGKVYVNGDDYYHNFDAYRAVLGYVPQDDIIHRTLPVERALDYAGRLRLPTDTANTEIAQRVDRVLEDVDMTPHRTKMVDNLSGGQRKRVSIGAELLADPSLFFLDEPTSGLDPGLEKKMMFTLRRLADSGRTVVLVTHATANITQCDHVIFMADGRIVYFGPPNQALAFFNVTSGDFADIYTKLDGIATPTDSDHWAVIQRDLQSEHARWKATHGDSHAPPTLAELWEMRFRESPQYTRYVAERLSDASTSQVLNANNTESQQTNKVSPIHQFGILARRYIDLILQDRRNLSILLLQAPIIGILLMFVAEPDAIVGDNAFASEAKKILFMLATVAVWFGIINAAREIVKEGAIYRRERLANLRIGPYVFSKMIVLTLLVILQSAIILGLIALRVQLPAQGVFLPIGIELFVTTWLTSLAGLAMGLAISAFASTPDRAISIVPLMLIPQILFAGVIFNLGDGITIQRILSWFTISRWAMDAYGTSVNLNDLPLQPGMLRLPNPPEEYTFTIQHLLSRWMILILYMCGCLGLTAWLLKRRDQ